MQDYSLVFNCIWPTWFMMGYATRTGRQEKMNRFYTLLFKSLGSLKCIVCLFRRNYAKAYSMHISEISYFIAKLQFFLYKTFLNGRIWIVKKQSIKSHRICGVKLQDFYCTLASGWQHYTKDDKILITT